MNNIRVLGLALLVMLCNVAISHASPVVGLMLDPVALTAATWLVCFRMKNLNAFYMSVLVALFIVLADVPVDIFDRHGDAIYAMQWFGIGSIVLRFMGLMPTMGILAAAMFGRNEDDALPGRSLLLVGIMVLYVTKMFMW